MLTLTDVRKRYQGQERDAVAGVSLEAAAGDFIALMGPSACGKSTLLHLCGAMDRADSGRVLLEEVDLSRASEHELTLVRRQRVGFVFQFFNLLPTLSLEENIALPLLLAGAPPVHATERARALGRQVGLEARLAAYPAQVSGGEMLRAAIARAIVHRPRLLVADEPTGNLDSGNGTLVLDLLGELNRTLGLTILLATHAPEIASAAHRVLHMRDGRLEPGGIDPVGSGGPPTATSVRPAAPARPEGPASGGPAAPTGPDRLPR